jgi:CubicO group peptidase (beta-lactamase class C family)
MFPTRRSFLKHLGLGAGVFVLAPTLRFQSAWAAEVAGLARSTPEAEGVSSAAIQAFIDGLAKNKHEMHSFMLARHGKVIAEGWWAPYEAKRPHTLYSLSKSFTSTAVGFAVTENLLSVDDEVVSFFKDDLPEKISDNLAALKIKHLLTMSVGSEKEPTQDMVKEQNWVRYFLGHAITHAPGSVFLYNSAATYMCSAIVNEVTGQSVLDFLIPRLFQPLGIEEPTWETCPRGINTGGWGLSLPTEALAKFGQMILQKGQWNDKVIIPEEWLEDATKFHIQQPDPKPDASKPARPKEKNDWLQGYGYQFWRCTHKAFRGDGAFGQFMVVMPDQDAVLAITSETSNMQGVLDLVWEHLFPAMKPAALPVNATTQARLQQTLASLMLPLPDGKLSSPTAAQVTGKNYKFETNTLGLDGASFEFKNDSCVVTFREGQDEHTVTCGLQGWARGETDLPGTPPRIISGGAPPPGTDHPVAAMGRWKDDRTFEMTWRYYETPHHDTITCVFDGDKLQVTFLASVERAGKRPVLVGSNQ